MSAQEFRTIREVLDGLDSKKVSATELAQHFLRESARLNPELNAYITICQERALKQARAVDAQIARDGRSKAHPLLGVPLAVKDVLVIDGVRTTCGSKILEGYVPPYTATAVERLERAGAVSLGKLNMDEFAMGGSNENSAYGPVRHPTHPDRVPGGSSGGSAAAVRAGLCVASLGTDTGGSVRLPASYCGVVGLKPTYGRISRYGVVAFASSLDQVGPMSHTVEDAALLLQIMAGQDAMDATSAMVPVGDFVKAAQTAPDWSKLRVGVPKEYFVGGLAPKVEAAIQGSLKFLEGKGARLVPVSLPHTELSVAVYYVIALCEASSNLARFDGVRYGARSPEVRELGDLDAFYRKFRTAFGQEVKRRIMLGTFALSSGYYDAYYRKACQVRTLIADDFDAVFKQVDIIAAPVAPTTAYRLGEKASDPLEMYLNDIFTVPANLAGLPAISVPCGQDEAGLSIGLHLMAPHFQEERLLSVAAGFEKGRA